MCNAIRIVQNEVAAICNFNKQRKIQSAIKINTYNEVTILEQFCQKEEKEIKEQAQNIKTKKKEFDLTRI